MARRIYLVTPLRDEIENLPALVEVVTGQTHAIAAWIVLENGSTDGSREYLAKLTASGALDKLIVLNLDTEEASYKLGFKYSRIIDAGFKHVWGNFEVGDEDLVGILDADSFPQKNYYEKLAAHFDQDPALGITSGLSYDLENGRVSTHARDWVRGSCRLWRAKCLREAGYLIGPSADSLSVALADLKGWRIRVTPGTRFDARTVGGRGKHRYYGEAAWFRGNTPLYAAMKAGKYVATGDVTGALQYASGYLGSWRARTPRVPDPAIFRYFQGYVGRKARKLLAGARR